MLHIVEARVLIALDVDEVERRGPDLRNRDDIEPGAADDVQDKHKNDNELDDLQLGLVTLIQL